MEMRTEDGSVIHRCLSGEPEAFGLLVDKEDRTYLKADKKGIYGRR
jgi:hypothetical protein